MDTLVRIGKRTQITLSGTFLRKNMKKRHSKKQSTYKENYVFGGVFAEDPLDIYNILVEYDDEGIRAECH